nr:hypothetical protein [Glycomyces terrestris]
MSLWSYENVRFRPSALMRPVPGSMTTAPCANFEFWLFASFTVSLVSFWRSGSSVVMIVYPPWRSSRSRSAGVAPNASCSRHQRRK